MSWSTNFMETPRIMHSTCGIFEKKKYKFKLKIVGSGEMQNFLQAKIIEKNLTSEVELVGPLSTEEVRAEMEKSEFMLCTSDRHEGWGVVVNEGLNSGCVVADSLIGSVPYMISDGVNGLIYDSENATELCRTVDSYFNDKQALRKIAKKAYYSIINEWSAEIAAQRLPVFVHEINDKGYCDEFQSGPYSVADRIPDNWFVKDN